ncbi:MAG: aminotransferase class IV, partial [Bryobacteraceae bacterium]
VLFAYDRHWERMERDAALLRIPFPDNANALHDDLLRLVEANEAWNATLRVYVIRNRGGIWEGPGIERPFDIVAYSTGLTQWGASVRLSVKPEARHSRCEFAGTKVNSWGWNLAWHEEAHARGYDEVVLLNERGQVSECTSANVFAVRADEAWTPPLDSGCLPGVTRALLLSEVRAESISVIEKPLRLADLESADGVFITSTTRDVLPVSEIEGLRVRNDRRVTDALQAAFTAYRERYIAARHARSRSLSGQR